jgi:hypothetical protein
LRPEPGNQGQDHVGELCRQRLHFLQRRFRKGWCRQRLQNLAMREVEGTQWNKLRRPNPRPKRKVRSAASARARPRCSSTIRGPTNQSSDANGAAKKPKTGAKKATKSDEPEAQRKLF